MSPLQIDEAALLPICKPLLQAATSALHLHPSHLLPTSRTSPLHMHRSKLASEALNRATLAALLPVVHSKAGAASPASVVRGVHRS